MQYNQIQVPILQKTLSFPDSENRPMVFSRSIVRNDVSPSYLVDSVNENRNIHLNKGKNVEKLEETIRKLAGIVSNKEEEILVLKDKNEKENQKFSKISIRYAEAFKNIQEKVSNLISENNKLQEICNMDGDELINKKLEILASENEKLNVTIKEQFVELDLWKEKYKEKERKTLEIARFESDYQNIIAQLNNEKNGKIELETKLEEKKNEISVLSEKQQDFEKRLEMLKIENERLSFLIGQKKELIEIQNLKMQLKGVYNENEKLLKILDERDKEIFNLRQLESKLEGLLAENNKLTTGLEEALKSNLALKENQKNINDTNNDLRGLEMRTKLLLSENENINKLLKDSFEEISKYKSENLNMEKKINELISKESDFLESYDSLENKLKLILEENSKLSEIIDNKNRELQGYKDIEYKIERLVHENEKLNKNMIEKRNEVEYWKKRYFDNI